MYMFLAVQEGHWRFLDAVPLALKNLSDVFSKHRFLGETFPRIREIAKRFSAEEVLLSPSRLMGLIDHTEEFKDSSTTLKTECV